MIYNILLIWIIYDLKNDSPKIENFQSLCEINLKVFYRLKIYKLYRQNLHNLQNWWSSYDLLNSLKLQHLQK